MAQQARVIVQADGSVTLPEACRRALGLHSGDSLDVEVVADGLRLVRPVRDVALAQAIVARHAVPGRSVVDEFLAERRAEAARDQ